MGLAGVEVINTHVQGDCWLQTLGTEHGDIIDLTGCSMRFIDSKRVVHDVEIVIPEEGRMRLPSMPAVGDADLEITWADGTIRILFYKVIEAIK